MIAAGLNGHRTTDGVVAAPIKVSARRNLWLDALKPADFESLLPHLLPVTVQAGETLAPRDRMFFPLTALVGVEWRLSEGEVMDTLQIGRDSLAGGDMSGRDRDYRLVVRHGGQGLVAAVRTVEALAEASPTLGLALRTAVRRQGEQAQRTACWRAHHRIDRRMANWLQHGLNTTDDTIFRLSQSDMAAMLGVQRTTLNAAAKALKQAGALSRTGL